MENIRTVYNLIDIEDNKGMIWNGGELDLRSVYKRKCNCCPAMLLNHQVRTIFLYLDTNRLYMTRQAIIERTLKAINQLPEDKAEEISEFADFVSKRYEEHQLTQSIQKLTAGSQAFEFLHNEEDLYSIKDLKEVYNA